MSLQLFNTLSGRKEEFKPLNPPEVCMYTCGPTVYDYAHIGNFRTFVFQDLLKRYLIYKGYQVRHVMNITDVDDKTIAGANREHVTLDQYTPKYTTAFFEDLKTLGILEASEVLYATKTIPDMIRLIETLVKKGHAYEKSGSVYFKVVSFPKYGALSKKKLDKNITGARVEQDEYEKEEGADFALWKAAKEGEPSWDSPWGKGRPGWHIECSTMSLKASHHETLDIHTGGEDLVFPHHENEIAQSECATEKPFVKYWLHVRHLLVDGKKMSKKDKNFYTLRDLLKQGIDSRPIRFLLLSTHYRKPLNFTMEGIKAAKESLIRIRDFQYCVRSLWDNSQNSENRIFEIISSAALGFEKAMDDDLNVSEAIAVIFEFIRKINVASKNCSEMREQDCKKVDELLKKVDSVLNVFFQIDESIPPEVQNLLDEYGSAKVNKNWTEVDKLRAKVKKFGYYFEDTSQGVRPKKIL